MLPTGSLPPRNSADQKDPSPPVISAENLTMVNVRDKIRKFNSIDIQVSAEVDSSRVQSRNSDKISNSSSAHLCRQKSLHNYPTIEIVSPTSEGRVCSNNNCASDKDNEGFNSMVEVQNVNDAKFDIKIKNKTDINRSSSVMIIDKEVNQHLANQRPCDKNLNGIGDQIQKQTPIVGWEQNNGSVKATNNSLASDGAESVHSHYSHSHSIDSEGDVHTHPHQSVSHHSGTDGVDTEYEEDDCFEEEISAATQNKHRLLEVSTSTGGLFPSSSNLKNDMFSDSMSALTTQSCEDFHCLPILEQDNEIDNEDSENSATTNSNSTADNKMPLIKTYNTTQLQQRKGRFTLKKQRSEPTHIYSRLKSTVPVWADSATGDYNNLGSAIRRKAGKLRRRTCVVHLDGCKFTIG